MIFGCKLICIHFCDSYQKKKLNKIFKKIYLKKSLYSFIVFRIKNTREKECTFLLLNFGPLEKFEAQSTTKKFSQFECELNERKKHSSDVCFFFWRLKPQRRRTAILASKVRWETTKKSLVSFSNKKMGNGGILSSLFHQILWIFNFYNFFKICRYLISKCLMQCSYLKTQGEAEKQKY